jgi:uncharacterized protein with ATP-grasp and redox domains
VKTYLDCIPCFFKQALEASRIAGADTETQRQILNEVARVLPEFPLEASPPQMAWTIYGLVKEYTQKEDPYLRIKEKSNQFAMGFIDQITNKLVKSRDRLLTAIELAIAGNIIDYGVKNTLDIDEELERIMASEQKVIKNEDGKIFQFKKFKTAVMKAKSVLYLADNAGETVFDRILLEEIKNIDHKKEMIYAVKEKPIINDALIKDALDCGIDCTADIMSSGSDAPGTILSLCSDEFMDKYNNADMVISKGQGNFEGLSETKRSIFFLLLAKCPVIARDVGCRVGDVILLFKKGLK